MGEVLRTGDMLQYSLDHDFYRFDDDCEMDIVPGDVDVCRRLRTVYFTMCANEWLSVAESERIGPLFEALYDDNPYDNSCSRKEIEDALLGLKVFENCSVEDIVLRLNELEPCRLIFENPDLVYCKEHLVRKGLLLYQSDETKEMIPDWEDWYTTSPCYRRGYVYYIDLNNDDHTEPCKKARFSGISGNYIECLSSSSDGRFIYYSTECMVFVFDAVNTKTTIHPGRPAIVLDGKVYVKNGNTMVCLEGDKVVPFWESD